MKNSNPQENKCPVCGSLSNIRFNSYKHYCFACYDCNSIFHEKKKGKYLLEYFLPQNILLKILPRQAYLRLFHVPKNKIYDRASFYDVYSSESLNNDKFRISQAQQFCDQFEINGINLEGKRILDISGGPGVVASELAKKGADVIVTEFSEQSVAGMKNHLGVNAIKFDYLNDKLEDVFNGKLFDIVAIRSSIIFSGDIEKLLKSIDKIIEPSGYLLVETIIPSLGEVFWWQQMEFKFPIIYSQESLEKYFYKFGYQLKYGYREYGDYNGIKLRSNKEIKRQLFTWLIDYPMMLCYYLLAPKRKIPFDQSTRHKFITQLWRKDHFINNLEEPKYFHYKSGSINKSPHFSYIYNGYLKN